jgi:MFS family permease
MSQPNDLAAHALKQPFAAGMEGVSPATAAKRRRRVVVASSLGAVFEAYDIVLFGPLAAIIAKHFFSGLDETSAYILTLLSLGLGAVVRPLGGVVFGRLGDLVGRKIAFLVTIVIAGVSTFLVGLLPSYAAIGIASPALLMLMRILQGLALGGEFGGAVVYIAEHAHPSRRGLATSAIHTTTALGLMLAIVVVLACQALVGKDAFEEWGWRIPFLLSGVMLLISVYIRLKLEESPVFQELKRSRRTSTAPLAEALGTWRYAKRSLIVLFGAVAGHAVVSATATYPIYLLMLNLKIDWVQLQWIILGSSACSVIFIVAAGWLSDHVGRKPLVLAGMLLMALGCFPLYQAVTHYASPALEEAVARTPVVVYADRADCSLRLDPLGVVEYKRSCDIARTAAAKAAAPYVSRDAPAGAVAYIQIGDGRLQAFDGRELDSKTYAARFAAFGKQVRDALTSSGYPPRAVPQRTNVVALIGVLATLSLFAALASGPMGAWLSELFPTRIRGTSFSTLYQIGWGWFGGLLPTISFTAFAATGNLYAGLWYSLAVIVPAFFISLAFLTETRGRRLEHVE